jgi:uncharacterized BrkB/YihY/UPF0761 family membrane protein
LGKPSAGVALGVGVAIWIIGVVFSIGLGAMIEGMNPDWENEPTPDSYIGAQTVILAMFLPMLSFSIIGSALVIPAVNAMLREH